MQKLAGVVPGCRVVEVGGAAVGTFDAASAALAMFRICGDAAVPVAFDLRELPDDAADAEGASDAVLFDRVPEVASSPSSGGDQLRAAFEQLDLDGTGNLHKVIQARK